MPTAIHNLQHYHNKIVGSIKHKDHVDEKRYQTLDGYCGVALADIWGVDLGADEHKFYQNKGS